MGAGISTGSPAPSGGAVTGKAGVCTEGARIILHRSPIIVPGGGSDVASDAVAVIGFKGIDRGDSENSSAPWDRRGLYF